MLGHAAMSVKPVLLTLYERYFLPLQRALLPSLQAFIMGLLPGLEEGAEVYDRYSLTPTIRNLYYNLNQFVNELWLCYFRKIALEEMIDILIDII